MYIGPESLLRQSSSLGANIRSGGFEEASDAIEAHEWKCVRTLNGIFFLALFFLFLDDCCTNLYFDFIYNVFIFFYKFLCFHVGLDRCYTMSFDI